MHNERFVAGEPAAAFGNMGTGLTSPNCGHDASWDQYPFVSVLVLNWNGQRYLRECFNSLRFNSCPHVEVVLIDNGSQDESVDFTRGEFPNVRIIRHSKNLGFCQGYNLGVDAVHGAFLVFLNNDTVVEKGWLEPLIGCLRAESDVAIATSKILFVGSRIVNMAGGILKLWTGAADIGYGRHESWLERPGAIEPFYGSGAAMAMRRDLFQLVGGFDKDYFAYGEDLDLSWRLRLIGYRVRLVRESVVHHHHSGTLGLFNPRKVRLVTRNHLSTLIKCLALHNALHAIPAYASFALIKGVALSIVRRDASFLLAIVLSIKDVVVGFRPLLGRRRETQLLRRVTDAEALRSEQSGLITSPREWVRILSVARSCAGSRS